MGLAHSIIAPYGKVSCSDGEVVIVCQQHFEWVRFCEGILQRPDLIKSPRFATNTDRLANIDALFAIITARCQTLTRAELITLLEDSNHPLANVSSVPDLSAHPALRQIEIDTPGGKAMVTASPLRDDIKLGPVPDVGEHNKQLRAEFGP